MIEVSCQYQRIEILAGLDNLRLPRQIYRSKINQWAIGTHYGLNYYFWNYFALNGNYSWNVLNTETDDPIIPAFNTPEHKYNIGIGGRDIPLRLGNLTLDNFGFNVSYKWIEGFLFEGSPQFTGFIPNYDLLDAQINWRAEKINTTFKC